MVLATGVSILQTALEECHECEEGPITIVTEYTQKELDILVTFLHTGCLPSPLQDPMYWILTDLGIDMENKIFLEHEVQDGRGACDFDSPCRKTIKVEVEPDLNAECDELFDDVDDDFDPMEIDDSLDEAGDDSTDEDEGYQKRRKGKETIKADSRHCDLVKLLTKVYRSVNQNQDKGFECATTTCKQKFNSFEALRTHEFSNHSGSVCPRCLNNQGSKFKLNDHLNASYIYCCTKQACMNTTNVFFNILGLYCQTIFIESHTKAARQKSGSLPYVRNDF